MALAVAVAVTLAVAVAVALAVAVAVALAVLACCGDVKSIARMVAEAASATYSTLKAALMASP